MTRLDALWGIRLVPAPHMVETVEARVPGGYMNRWLVCGVVTRPMRHAYHIGNTGYAHPAVIEQLKKELKQ